LLPRAVGRNRHAHEHVADVHLCRPSNPQQYHRDQRATVGPRPSEYQDGCRDRRRACQPDALAANRVGQESAHQDGRPEHRAEAADEAANFVFSNLKAVDE
jgi:hypothetical protein